jgi:hypothetical protein
MEKQIVRTASRQLRELSRAKGQNESGKVAQVFAGSRSSHTKVCISALFAKWNCEK